MLSKLTRRRFVAPIQNVLYDAMNPAHPASKSVPGLANIKAAVLCRAQHPAVDFHVTSAVIRHCRVVTDAQVFVAKYVRKSTAKSAQITEMIVLTFLK